MFQVLFFFIISCKILCKNNFNLFVFYYFFFYKFTKIEIKSLKCPKSIRNYEINKCLEHQTLGKWVVCPIDPATQRIILKIVGFQVLTKEFWSSTKLADVLNLRQKCANNVISALCEQVYSVDIYYFSTPGAQKTISFNKWGYVLCTI